jgi:hypothetical protein
MIMMALAGFLWRKIQSKYLRPGMTGRRMSRSRF